MKWVETRLSRCLYVYIRRDFIEFFRYSAPSFPLHSPPVNSIISISSLLLPLTPFSLHIVSPFLQGMTNSYLNNVWSQFFITCDTSWLSIPYRLLGKVSNEAGLLLILVAYLTNIQIHFTSFSFFLPFPSHHSILLLILGHRRYCSSSRNQSNGLFKFVYKYTFCSYYQSSYSPLDAATERNLRRALSVGYSQTRDIGYGGACGSKAVCL